MLSRVFRSDVAFTLEILSPVFMQVSTSRAATRAPAPVFTVSPVVVCTACPPAYTARELQTDTAPCQGAMHDQQSHVLLVRRTKQRRGSWYCRKPRDPAPPTARRNSVLPPSRRCDWVAGICNLCKGAFRMLALTTISRLLYLLPDMSIRCGSSRASSDACPALLPPPDLVAARIAGGTWQRQRMPWRMRTASTCTGGGSVPLPPAAALACRWPLHLLHLHARRPLNACHESGRP